MLRPFLFIGLILSTCIIFFSCMTNLDRQNQTHVKKWMQQDNKIKVLSTTGMISDTVQTVGGDHVDSLTLIKGDLDPHSYVLVKGDDEKFHRADIIFYNGLGLEHSPSIRYHLTNSPKALALSNVIQKNNPKAILWVDGKEDPHIWMDISLWAQTIDPIVEHLSQLDPEHANDYKINGEILFKKMQLKNQEVRNELQAIPDNKRYLVTSHDAFNYFAKAYLATEEEMSHNTWHERFRAPEGLAPDTQLSTNDIQDILSHLCRYHIQYLFMESNVSPDSIKKIVHAGRERGLDLKIADVILYGDAMGEPGTEGQTYLGMIQHDANAITNTLNQTSPYER